MERHLTKLRRFEVCRSCEYLEAVHAFVDTSNKSVFIFTTLRNNDIHLQHEKCIIVSFSQYPYHCHDHSGQGSVPGVFLGQFLFVF